MDRVVINDEVELLLKNVKNILIVCDDKIVMVDVETSTISEVDRGTISMALGAL